MTKDVKWISPQQTQERQDKMNRLLQEPSFSSLSRATLNILINRGMDTVEKIQGILEDDIMKQHNPMLMKDSDQLILHLKNAVEQGKHIVVYGDYDSGATRS